MVSRLQAARPPGDARTMNDENFKTPPCIAEAVQPAIAAFIRNLDDLVESRPGLRPYVFRVCRFLERRDKEYFPMGEGFLGGWFCHDGDMGTVTLGDCRRLFADADGLRLSWIWSHGIRVAVVHGPDDGACAAEAIREHPEDWGVLQNLFAGHRRGTGLGLGHAGEDALLALLAATAAKRGLYLSAMDGLELRDQPFRPRRTGMAFRPPDGQRPDGESRPSRSLHVAAAIAYHGHG